MKRFSMLFVLLSVLLPILMLSGCMSRIYDTEDFIQKAREVVPIADSSSIAMTAVESGNGNGDSRLVWIISGSENQQHCYMPIEFKEIGKDHRNVPYYEFVRCYEPVERCEDTAAVQWMDGYSFLVNNELCRAVRITDENGTHEYPVTGIPCVICYDGSTSFEYNFININGSGMIP